MVTTELSNNRISEQNIKPLVAELVSRFADATGIMAPIKPRVELGGCGGVDALLLSSIDLRIDTRLIYNPDLFKKIAAHVVAQSVLFQSGINGPIHEYSRAFKDKEGTGFDNAQIALNKSPSLLIIKGMAEAPADQFAALCASEDFTAENSYGTTMHALRLYTTRSIKIVAAMADELSKALNSNDVTDAKGIMEKEWPAALYKAFCREAEANGAIPDAMSTDYKVAYYGKMFALSDAIRFDYDYKKALNYEIKALQALSERISEYINDPDTWLGWLR